MIIVTGIILIILDGIVFWSSIKIGSQYDKNNLAEGDAYD